MKFSRLLAATASVAALSSVALSAHAQGGVMATTNPATGKPVIMMEPGMTMRDHYMASWIYNNLDAYAVHHYHSLGLNDGEIKGCANIAMRAGLDMPYVVRLFRESGMPLYAIASQFNVSTKYVDSDIMGYGADAVSMPMMAPMGGGMMHGTMVTPMASGSVVDALMANPDLSTLVAAAKAADLVSMLSGPGPFTIFAPTNEAFAKLPAGTVDDLMKPENKDKLRAVLQYHVVPGKIMAADVMAMANPSMPKTEEGATLTVKTTAPVMVNGANVTQTDIVGSNGVVHVIDTVLMPPMAQ